MIRLIIVDDHAIVRHGLKQILALAPDISVVGEAGGGKELQAVLVRTACDLVLLDMNMPGLAGVELIEWIHAEYPNLPILILSMHVRGRSPAARSRLAQRLSDQGTASRKSSSGPFARLPAEGKFFDAALVEKLCVRSCTGKLQPA